MFSGRLLVVVVAVVAVVAADLSLRLVSHAEEGKAEPGASVQASAGQPILVNITRGTDEVHAVSMALGLAQSAIKDGRPAVVFLNVEAPAFAAKDLSTELKCADFSPIKQMLAEFVAMGGKLLVCRHCAHVVDVSQEEMIVGAKLVGHEELFAAMPPGTTVFSY